MMRFVIFVIDNQTNSGNPGEMAAIDAFNEALMSAGNWITAAGISGFANSKLIDNRDEKQEVLSGSLVQTEDNYSGFWLIQAESESEALELALAGSKACNRRVELRPYLGQ